MELNIWRNPDYKANEIGLTENAHKEHGSSEHWDNCGDSKFQREIMRICTPGGQIQKRGVGPDVAIRLI